MDPEKARKGSAQSGHPQRPPTVVLRSSPERFPRQEGNAQARTGPVGVPRRPPRYHIAGEHQHDYTSKDRNNVYPD